MDLELTETQRLMQESLAAFLEAEVPLDRIRALEREQGIDRALWKALAEQGWLGLHLPESLGGGGASLIDLGLLVESLARRAVIVPILESAVCARALQGSDVVEALLPAVVGGDAIVVPAVLEAADRFDAISARVDGRGAIAGEKRFVDYAQHATHHLVAATGPGGVGLRLVDVRDAAPQLTPLRTVGRTPACNVVYAPSPSRPVGDAGALAWLVQLARALAAVQCVGSLEQSLDMTVRYASVREQFGKPIGSFQAVRHHCANMAIRIASARMLAFEALTALDAGELDVVRVAAAKAAVSRAAPDVLMLSHQVHGGNGVIEENDLYFFTLRGRERALAWGGVEECLAVLAEHVEQPVDWL